jgi:hypothetical protein
VSAPIDFPYADATYRRRIMLEPSGAAITAEMEDYMHHFRVRVVHRDGEVTAADAEGVRVPWTSCPGGAAGIRALVGTALAEAHHADSWASDRSGQCVHVVDLALLAAAHAYDATPTTYMIELAPVAQPVRRATLWHNGEPALAWTLEQDTITSAGPMHGVSLAGKDFFPWVGVHLSAGEQEAARVLRRACSIGVSRGLDPDVYTSATELRGPANSCYTFRPEVTLVARRTRGSARRTEEPGYWS